MSIEFNKRDLACMGSGFILGYAMNRNGLLVGASSVYIGVISLTRCLLALALTQSNGYLYKELNRNLGMNILDSRDIELEYNCFRNVVTVRRTLSGKFITDKDAISSEIRRFFNTLLCYDIFYYIYPLKIEFK